MGRKIVYIFNAGLDLLLKKSKSLRGYERRALMVLLAVMVVLTVFYVALLRAPAHFPEGETVTI